MKLLYISYWGANDALTKATVLPNLKILRTYFSEVYFATMERSDNMITTPIAEVIHIPFHTYFKLWRLLGKTFDLIHFSIKLFWLVKRQKIDYVICRGAMAATFGLFLNRFSRLPFIVESFEPHADYMLEGNTWKKGGVEYKFQKWVESRSIKHAKYLMPVSHNYSDYLKEIGVAQERILVMPCCVDLEKFQYNSLARKSIRKKLEILDNATVGIYVGKFGDIYLLEEAFQLFRKVQDYFKNTFYLIILSPVPKSEIAKHLSNVSFKNEMVHIDNVPHDLVPGYLSAADFAFSLVRPSPSRKFCSPIKNGEYWANGLPILTTKGVGDDGDIISKTNTGVILDLESNLEHGLKSLKSLLNSNREALVEKITPLAYEHRNFEIIVNGYDKVFGNWLQVN